MPGKIARRSLLDQVLACWESQASKLSQQAARLLLCGSFLLAREARELALLLLASFLFLAFARFVLLLPSLLAWELWLASSCSSLLVGWNFFNLITVAAHFGNFILFD